MNKQSRSYVAADRCTPSTLRLLLVLSNPDIDILVRSTCLGDKGPDSTAGTMNFFSMDPNASHSQHLLQHIPQITATHGTGNALPESDLHLRIPHHRGLCFR